MENLAYLYVLAEEAALPEISASNTTTLTKNHQSGESHRSCEADLQPFEGGKAGLEGDRVPPSYPTFYL